jgi:hypothetical protein
MYMTLLHQPFSETAEKYLLVFRYEMVEIKILRQYFLVEDARLSSASGIAPAE